MDIEIRGAKGADAKRLLEIYAPAVETGPTSFETVLPSAAEFGERIRRTLETHPWLVACVGGEAVGYAYAGAIRARAAYQWSCEVSVYVREDHHRRGVGSRLYEALFASLREQGFVNAFAGITLPNPASVALHERCGFESVGVYRRIGFKNGAWHDVGWWGLRLREVTGEPAPPVGSSS